MHEPMLPLKPIPGLEPCAGCGFWFPVRELNDVEIHGQRLRLCRACRAKVVPLRKGGGDADVWSRISHPV